jgi:hypothetical protein
VTEPGRDRSAHRDAVELAPELREHEADRASAAPVEVGIRLIAAARARPQILVREVEDVLVVRVRVDRSS